MSEATYLTACCVAPIENVTRDETEDEASRVDFLCSKCDKLVGFYMDGGELDLEALRTDGRALNPDNRFEIFGV